MRINYTKHFTEDTKQEEDKSMLAYKTKRYIRKVKMRNQCENIKPEEFLNDPKYELVNVWDLVYISTSDDEDNDTSEDEDSEEESSGEEEEEEDESGEDEEESKS